MTASSGELLYLCRADVVEVCHDVDVVAMVERTLIRHARGETTLPAEAYLPWHDSGGSFARSLALPAAVYGERRAMGVKVINSSLGNQARGLPRAQGLILVFDPDRAHPVAILEAAYLSALRTAAYTVASARLLAVPDPERICIVGCGVLGERHAVALHHEYPAASFALYDHQPERGPELRERLRRQGVAASVVGSAREAIEGAQIVVTATTTTSSYLEYDWLGPGALVAHVSLDDVTPEVVRRADLLVVDDWELVRADDRRLLGRMYRAGELLGPDEARTDAAPRRVDGTLGGLLSNSVGRTDPGQIILSNPFGMGVLDIAVAEEIYHRATATGIGQRLPV